MATAVPMLAGRAIVIAWYGAMGEALQAGKEDVVFRLFEAALSVPIRLRLCPDEDTCHVVSLLFAENLFASSAASGAESFWKFAEKVGMLTGVRRAVADNVSLPKLCAAVRAYGLTFKGKALTEGNVKAFKSLVPFVGNEACAQAYSLMECVCPELRESTLLMRIAQLSSAKASSNSSDKQDESACHSLAFVFDCSAGLSTHWQLPQGGRLHGEQNLWPGKENPSTGAPYLQEEGHYRLCLARGGIA